MSIKTYLPLGHYHETANGDMRIPPLWQIIDIKRISQGF
jgi:hypothetical protein